MAYKEVIINYDLHFHIDVDTGEPIQMYRWLFNLPEYDEDITEDHKAAYVTTKNPLFVRMRDIGAVRDSWKRNSHLASSEDLEGINFKQHPQ